MLVAFFGVGENCCSISAQKTTNKIFVKIVDNWKQRLGLDMQMSYSYPLDLPFKNLCKLAKQAETI